MRGEVCTEFQIILDQEGRMRRRGGKERKRKGREGLCPSSQNPLNIMLCHTSYNIYSRHQLDPPTG